MRARFILRCTLLAIGALSASGASIMYAVTGAGASPSSLYQVDPTTGASTLIGATGFSHITGLAYDPISGIMYAHESDIFGSGATNLLTIDLLTGAGTLVGSTGIQVPDMTFSSTGVLYAWSEFGLGNSDDLYTIDVVTAAATFLGESGAGTSNTGLGFSPNGTLYMKSGSQLYSLNPVTGVATFLVNLSQSLNNSVAFNPDNGTAFSIFRTGGATFLMTFDPVTGNVTQVGDMGVGGISALAFVPDAVPEPSTVLLSLAGLALLAAYKRRRA